MNLAAVAVLTGPFKAWDGLGGRSVVVFCSEVEIRYSSGEGGPGEDRWAAALRVAPFSFCRGWCKWHFFDFTWTIGKKTNSSSLTNLHKKTQRHQPPVLAVFWRWSSIGLGVLYKPTQSTGVTEVGNTMEFSATCSFLLDGVAHHTAGVWGPSLVQRGSGANRVVEICCLVFLVEGFVLFLGEWGDVVEFVAVWKCFSWKNQAS